jgi:hypothetical protein
VRKSKARFLFRVSKRSFAELECSFDGTEGRRRLKGGVVSGLWPLDGTLVGVLCADTSESS